MPEQLKSGKSALQLYRSHADKSNAQYHLHNLRGKEGGCEEFGLEFRRSHNLT